MSVKLMFITSHYFYQPTLDALARLQFPCETTVIPYDNFDHIVQIYGHYADSYDACFTSGVIAKHAIELAYPGITKPLVAFQISPNALHRGIRANTEGVCRGRLRRPLAEFLRRRSPLPTKKSGTAEKQCLKFDI